MAYGTLPLGPPGARYIKTREDTTDSNTAYVTRDDYCVIFTQNPTQVVLPPCETGKELVLRGVNTLLVVPDGSDTISNLSSKSSFAFILIGNGTNWMDFYNGD